MFVITLAILCGTSCRSEAPKNDGRVDSSATTQKSPALAPTAGHYAARDFARLRWLEGSWRGRLPDGGSFYERYRSLDDSTIAMHGFADSTFARATDSARIVLRGGTIADEGGSRWVATRLDSTGVDFAAERNAANNFTWAPESRDRWTATLRSVDREGRAKTVVYPMQRSGH